MHSRPLVLGHRGAPLLARENTVAAFRAALDEGADGVELDVQCSSDGLLVLHHDTQVDGVPVHHLTAAALRDKLGELDTLEDAFAALPASAWIFVEVKRQLAAVQVGLVDRLAGLIDARGAERTWLGSFDPWLPELVRATAPALRTGWIVDRVTVGALERVEVRADVLSMEHPLATGSFLDRVTAAETLAWPVDQAEDLDRCFDRFPRLTGVVTKHPRLARARWDAR
jgi:glycerophosphoryl diester phosphodiesterase